MGLTPDWPLIWVVCWSVRRTMWQGAVAGIVLGWIQDGLSYPQPTHSLSLALVGILTARLQKQRYIQEDFISIALIVFGMVVIAQTILALQWTLLTLIQWQPHLASSVGPPSLAVIWANHQRTALTSAILSSLWAPILYLPLRQWWQQDMPGDA